MDTNTKNHAEEILAEMIKVSEDIYKHPELGFKEVRTAGKVMELLDAHGISYRSGIAHTGVLATLDSGRPGPHIGLICELDAVPTLNHPYSNEEDGAAHTCGHYAQIGVMMSVFLTMKESGLMENLSGKVTLIAVPAEEFCDFDYRNNLIEEGKISYISGKREMIHLGVLDDIDIMLSCHTMGLDPTQYDAEIGASLNGFISKRIVFLGKGAHAGGNPSGGINALNAANLAMTGINFLRETFREEDAIRVHFILTEAGHTVNTIPERTSMDMYVRAKTVEAIKETNKKVTRALRAGAYAIGCDVEITDTPGYFPLQQDEALTDFTHKQISQYIPPERIAHGTHGYASGDMGDFSLLWPTIEIGIGGFTGTMHGSDFKTDNEEQAYRVPALYFIDTVIGLLDNNGKAGMAIKDSFVPQKTRESYLAMLEEFSTKTLYTKEKEL